MQGLQNLGSTCAINSLIQIICRTDYLRDIIIKSEIPCETLSAELKEILDMMHTQKHSLSPRKFLMHLYKHFGTIFREGEQIDIGELWMFLFDKLATELGHSMIIEIDENPVTNNIKYINTYDNTMIAQHPDIIALCEHTIHKINNYKISTWLETSQGIMLNIIKCNKCCNALYNFEPFISIQLDIPDDTSVPSITTMFKNYLKMQTCNDGWKCESCNQYTSYTKSVKIWKMPKVLIFTINRFANAQMKNTAAVNINKTICIKKGSVLSDMSNDYSYKCTSIAYHFGNLFGGHYCTLCNVNDQFILYDDLNISIVNEEQMKNVFEGSKDAYMVVYTLLS
jgi:ubiquitin C-terminal hydrolase